MIKLIHKHVKMNNDTFAPELEATIRIPLEFAQDASVAGSIFYEKLGLELVSCLIKQDQE